MTPSGPQNVRFSETPVVSGASIGLLSVPALALKIIGFLFMTGFSTFCNLRDDFYVLGNAEQVEDDLFYICEDGETNPKAARVMNSKKGFKAMLASTVCKYAKPKLYALPCVKLRPLSLIIRMTLTLLTCERVSQTTSFRRLTFAWVMQPSQSHWKPSTSRVMPHVTCPTNWLQDHS